MKPTIESIYGVLSKHFSNDADLILIKKDLINWSAQNQEHHSFDENSYNFVHAKSSDEIHKIFVSIQKISFKLFPEREVKRLTKNKMELIKEYDSLMRKTENQDFRQKAPREIVRQHMQKVEEVHNELLKIVELLNSYHNSA